ncbi:MAG TPA: MBL fold metallo-hydrolase [Candidatus Avamphibacillus sp.]|nr:MBL fold metallo-hydrolase [Candidatus Avamphibacillus sp.]
MLFKKHFEQKTVKDVQMGNGTVKFQQIKLNVYCFFVDGVLIDTGAKAIEREFKSFFKELDIDQVAITHFHEDHTGNAHVLQEERNVPLYMSEIKREYCMTKADYPLYRKIFWGKRKPFRAEPIGETFTSRNATWKVIETPGHAIDHLAFLNKETGQLFTGDLYCQEKTKVILREESIPTIIDSLQKVLTYDFGDVFCSHAGYLKNGREALKRKLDYLLNIQGETLRMYDEGKPPESIKETLFPKKYPIILLSTGEWDSMHIVNSIIRDRNAP